jgi:hypothetical protein
VLRFAGVLRPGVKHFCYNLFVKNWRTSVAGLIAAIAGFVLFSPQLFARWPWVCDVAKYIMAGGLASLGLVGKDAATHSTAGEVVTASMEPKP